MSAQARVQECTTCHCLCFEPWPCDLCEGAGREIYCVHCYIKHLNEFHQTALMQWEPTAREAYKLVNGFYPQWDKRDLIDAFLERDGREAEEYGRRMAALDDRHAWGTG